MVDNDYSCQNFTLHKNYSNPFNPWTMIKYSAPVYQNFELNVYDLRGGLIKICWIPDILKALICLNGMQPIIWDKKFI